MDLLTVMWRVAFAVGGIASGLLGLISMFSAVFMKRKALGIKVGSRVVLFILGYLLLCFGVYLMCLLF